MQSCVARLLSPQGGPALVKASTVRIMPCPSARRAFGWLVGWRKLALNEPKHVNHERFRVQALLHELVVQVTLRHTLASQGCWSMGKPAGR